MKRSIFAIVVLCLFATSAEATGSEHEGKRKPARSSGKEQAQGQAQGQKQVQAQGQGQSQVATGVGFGGAGGIGGAGGAGGNAVNGGQFLTFSPVIGVGGGSGLQGRMVPDVSPPSMPSPTNCTKGISLGTSFAGFGGGAGWYVGDKLCNLERQHNLEMAAGNHAAARDIRHGMMMLQCEELTPEERKHFRPCDALPKSEPEPVRVSPAFSSAG